METHRCNDGARGAVELSQFFVELAPQFINGQAQRDNILRLQITDPAIRPDKYIRAIQLRLAKKREIQNVPRT